MSSGHLVLIAPVGLYTKRLWRAIVESKANKIYLVRELKPGYTTITSKIANEFKGQIEKFLLRKCNIDEAADFTNLEDIYRVFTKIIEKEKHENPEASFMIDITSTTKEGALVAGNIAALWGARVVYVPSKIKTEATPDEIRKIYEEQSKDEGLPLSEVAIPRAPFKKSVLSDDEKKLLKTIHQQGEHVKVKQIISRLCNKKDVASVKKYHRYLDVLASKGLAQIEREGREKRVTLTLAGKGIARGLMESA